MDEREQRIRERAHQLWEEEGRPDGRHEHHWLRAAHIVATEEADGEARHAADVAPGSVEREVPVADKGPVSEIDTVVRTLEIPAKRRGRGVPANDREGAMSGTQRR
ncbi:MAG TPA: DUF2934 domain-containing protein [Xanthobacteraceae bacterium]|nr:DUF2934 domain-containing protein [Xanthobacteraceae bacterium]